MIKELATVFSAIFYGTEGGEPLGGTDFRTFGNVPGVPGLLHRFARMVATTGEEAGADFTDDRVEAFLATGARLLHRELAGLLANDVSVRKTLSEAASLLSEEAVDWDEKTRATLWRLFFPEGAKLEKDIPEAVRALRRHRRVEVTEPNPSPITEPLRELIFTSNALITVPLDSASSGVRQLPEELRVRVLKTMEESQRYHYDHPIHIGVPLEANEAVYGLRGLDRMIGFEKERGVVAPEETATVILSLSVTHEGLHTVAPDYLRQELQQAGFENLKIYLFTELECAAVVDALFGDNKKLPEETVAAVREVFGVDGEYGRHYSFLKAVTALWQVAVDSKIRGTFKIDLDQVFPQQELAEETGESALEHFTTPLWGARGVDAQGTAVELGMIAGALVNEKDINRGLFTPDVPYPEEIPAGESVVFYNKLPMAMSTEAEMMTRYVGAGGEEPGNETSSPDGRESCLQRYHVTGGTNGILIDSLRRHRPFTPTFIGRAEDQAYILSQLYAGGGPHLRYLHKPGLIMRHDKEAFAGDAIEAAKHGRFIGDLVRTYYFSRYAEALHWGFDRIKEQIDPFTGCFVTKRTWTVIMLRLVLHAATLAASGPEGEEGAATVLELGARRLGPLAAAEDPHYQSSPEVAGGAPGPAGPAAVRKQYLRERDAWNAFYDALDAGDWDQARIKEIAAGCRVV